FFSCLFLSPPPRFSLFPYTTLFRSEVELVGADAKLGDDFVSRAPAAFAFIDPALPVGQASACQVEQNQNERAARNRDLAVVAPHTEAHEASIEGLGEDEARSPEIASRGRRLGLEEIAVATDEHPPHGLARFDLLSVGDW